MLQSLMMTGPWSSVCGTNGAEEFADPERSTGTEKMDGWVDVWMDGWMGWLAIRFGSQADVSQTDSSLVLKHASDKIQQFKFFSLNLDQHRDPKINIL